MKKISFLELISEVIINNTSAAANPWTTAASSPTPNNTTQAPTNNNIPWTTAVTQITPPLPEPTANTLPPVSATPVENSKPILDLNKLISIDELEKFKNISNSSSKEYNKKMFEYQRDYDFWRKSGGKPGDPNEPEEPEDTRSTEEIIWGTLKEILENHNGKSSYIEAIDHMLKFTDDNYKNWFQRLKSNL